MTAASANAGQETASASTCSASSKNAGDFFIGVNAREDAWYSYAGVNYALNGDASASGFLVHGLAGYGEYEYDTVLGGVDGEVTEFDLGIGYQWFVGGHRVSAIAAVNFVDHDLSGNPVDIAQNSVEGDEVGFKPKIDIWNTDASTILYGGTFSYSTSNDDYWNRVMAGYRVANMYVGPEVIFQGNDEYEEFRTGIAIAGLQLGMANVGASVGYSWADPKSGTDDQDGIYGTVHVSISF